MINIAIRATYYIFCCRNRNWDSPDLMQFWYFFLAFVLFLFLFCFVFVFVCLFFLFLVFCFFFLFINNAILSSICKLPIRSEIYNCRFKNTNKVSIIIIIIIILLVEVVVVVVRIINIHKQHINNENTCKVLCYCYLFNYISFTASISSVLSVHCF